MVYLRISVGLWRVDAMNELKEFVVPNLTAEEFKAKVIDFIESEDVKPELLRKILAELPKDKRELLEVYREDIQTDPINPDPSEWERGSYFKKQVYMAKINFCLKRLEHLIEVKSYLTERGIAGFSRPTPNSVTNHEKNQYSKADTSNVDFSFVDLTGFTPSKFLSNSVDNDDISSIRIALFMEMNNESISTVELRQAIAWVLTKHPTLFEPYEENAYSQGMEQNSEKWNEHYYSMQEVYASFNFSSERISHMVDVREQVFNIPQESQSATKMDIQKQSTSKQAQQHKESPNASSDAKPKNKVLYSLLLIGGGAAAIALVILAVIV